MSEINPLNLTNIERKIDFNDFSLKHNPVPSSTFSWTAVSSQAMNPLSDITLLIKWAQINVKF